MVNLTKLLVAEPTQHQVIGLLVNNELIRIWKEVVFTESELELRHLRGGTEESVRTVGFPTEIITGNLQNTFQIPEHNLV
jgi:hypothetical protein